MKPTVIFAALAVILLGVLVTSAARRAPTSTAAAPTQAALTATPTPTRERIVYPASYRDDYLLYAIIDRPDAITRQLYISPAALDATRAGQDFPERAQILVEAYDAARDANGIPLRDGDGHLIPGSLRPEIHVAETRSTWQMEDLASSSRLGNFNFAAFDAATGGHNGEFIADCFSCHNQAASVGFVFTRRQLLAYAETGVTQYFYCSQPARVPCRF